MSHRKAKFRMMKFSTNPSMARHLANDDQLNDIDDIDDLFDNIKCLGSDMKEKIEDQDLGGAFTDMLVQQ